MFGVLQDLVSPPLSTVATVAFRFHLLALPLVTLAAMALAMALATVEVMAAVTPSMSAMLAAVACCSRWTIAPPQLHRRCRHNLLLALASLSHPARPGLLLALPPFQFPLPQLLLPLPWCDETAVVHYLAIFALAWVVAMVAAASHGRLDYAGCPAADFS